MSLKAKVEAIIYAAEEPVTLEQISLLLKDIVLADLASAKENAAIEQADSAAEAETTESKESELLPELVSESAELICPEPGPLMPEEIASADVTQPESLEENIVDQGAPEDVARDEEVTSKPSTENLELAAPDATPTLETPVTEESATSAGELTSAESASVDAPETTSRKRQPKKTEQEIAEDKTVRTRVREVLVELVTDYASEDRGMEIRQVAGGFRMATKPEHHDVVRAFAKSLKPPIRLSLAALETLAVIAYKQPITGPEIADIRGVESSSVLGTLLDRKLITTAGRKQVIGRPMLYKTSKDFLLRFGLNDVNELPSMEEFSQLASDGTIEIMPSEQQEKLPLLEPNAESPSPIDEVAEGQLASASQAPEPLTGDPQDLEARHHELPIPEPQENDAAEAVHSQPLSEAEPSNVPETEHLPRSADR